MGTNLEPEFTSIVCLANSRKRQERCLAGKDADTGVWLRPVSARPDAAINLSERRYDDGHEPSLLDLVDVPFTVARPSPFQPENWLFDANWYWQKTGQLAIGDLDRLQDRPDDLWGFGSSTLAGSNDRVPESAGRSQTSLALVRARGLTARVFRPGAAYGDAQRKVRGAFLYHGREYDFTITDPTVESLYRAGEDGQYLIGDRFITVSLAEPYNGYAYKLIAAVFDE